MEFAEAEGIATFSHPHKGMKRAEFDAVIDAALRRADIEYVALAAICACSRLSSWRNGKAGCSTSTRPCFPNIKGLDTHQRALDAGDKVAGCSVHMVTAELDDGRCSVRWKSPCCPMIRQTPLAARILIAEHQLYPRMLARLVTAETRPENPCSNVFADSPCDFPKVMRRQSNGTRAFRCRRAARCSPISSRTIMADGITAVLVKTGGEEEQAMLIESDPDLYYRPAYLGPAGWVGIRLDRPPVTTGVMSTNGSARAGAARPPGG